MSINISIPNPIYLANILLGIFGVSVIVSRKRRPVVFSAKHVKTFARWVGERAREETELALISVLPVGREYSVKGRGDAIACSVADRWQNDPKFAIGEAIKQMEGLVQNPVGSFAFAESAKRLGWVVGLYGVDWDLDSDRAAAISANIENILVPHLESLRGWRKNLENRKDYAKIGVDLGDRFEIANECDDLITYSAA